MSFLPQIEEVPDDENLDETILEDPLVNPNAHPLRAVRDEHIEEDIAAGPDTDTAAEAEVMSEYAETDLDIDGAMLRAR